MPSSRVDVDDDPDLEAGSEEAEDEEEQSLKERVKERAKAKAQEKAQEKLSEFEGSEKVADIVGGDSFVVRALLWVVPGVYGLWYGIAAAFMAVFGLIDDFNAIVPFNHVDFSPMVEDGNMLPLINWMSAILSLTVAGPWLIYFAVRNAERATDTSSAVMSLHFFLATTVTQQTPENWLWWATMMPCGVFMGRMAEFMLARFQRPKRKAR